MLTDREIFLSSIVPLIVALAIGMIGFWRRWGWLAPLAAGAGFLAGYAAILATPPARVTTPAWPPHDGVDWLFWLAVPLTVLGVAGAALDRWWVIAGGAAAGVIAWVILSPIVGNDPAARTDAVWLAVVLSIVGVLGVVAAFWAGGRTNPAWVIAALSVATGAAGVLVFSSGMRNAGMYGMAGGAALMAATVAGLRESKSANRKSGGVAAGAAIVAVGLMAGLLASQRYADPVLSWGVVTVSAIAPALVGLAALIPGRRRWVAGVIALAAVAVAAASVTAPAALKAKREAESVKESGYGY